LVSGKEISNKIRQNKRIQLLPRKSRVELAHQVKMTSNQFSRAGLLTGWEGYPINVSPLYDEEDLRASHLRLKHDSERLFSKDTTEILFETILPYREGVMSEGDRLFTDLVINDGMLDNILIVRIPNLNMN
jgi:hypothetical protein